MGKTKSKSPGRRRLIPSRQKKHTMETKNPLERFLAPRIQNGRRNHQIKVDTFWSIFLVYKIGNEMLKYLKVLQ